MNQSATPAGKASIRYRFHWHVYFTHFPVSLFGVAFGFQILHLFVSHKCFELGTNVVLIAAVVMMVPTTWSGWTTWKTNYRGAKTRIFNRKIWISFIILVAGTALAVWRTVFLNIFDEHPESPAHWIYLFGNAILIIGAIAEGYYGGRLNHH